MFIPFFIITALVLAQPIFATTEIKKSEQQSFQSYTGKVTGNKVRLRINPDLESYIIKELKKNELFLVLGEENDFWAIKPQSKTKGYVFRSYVIDNTVEAERVNIRLSPDKEAPIIGKLQIGDKIVNKICEKNNKWLEINLPKNVKFYISKTYVSYAGDTQFLAKMEERKNEVDELLNSAFFITEGECKKHFNKMQPKEAIVKFESIIKNYDDFPTYVEQAKQGLSLLQDNYLQKKIVYLESKNSVSEEEKQQILSQITYKDVTKNYKSDPKAPIRLEPNLWGKHHSTNTQLSEQMKKWLPVEKELFSTWNSYHSDKNVENFYNEQKINAIVIEGKLEAFVQNVKNKPGDYLIKNEENQIPIAFLYSTFVDMEKHLGKKVTITVSPRPNNNFAFPAYFVTSIR
jgi:hypothetical protein